MGTITPPCYRDRSKSASKSV